MLACSKEKRLRDDLLIHHHNLTIFQEVFSSGSDGENENLLSNLGEIVTIAAPGVPNAATDSAVSLYESVAGVLNFRCISESSG